ncbi:peptidoglycan D,D-transpeptidase FtsI family protein [Helcobacillus massiliensis]|uniref:Peptidoglycan glycosyltransferase n=1 Tax=Helcobacillus massiliensis TaxID=521392 RepID=A0A839QWB4_9MICO|nr:penicillin-binding transpeptidase domain-containing protein [Helcobacillus massiliensis]MBB3023139.1 peptidoglycan glycosyltransferase [Helcobacillus massiliensis]
MNKPLRHVSLVLAVLFLLLFGSSTYFQAIRTHELSADSRNARAIYNEYGRARGPIVVDGEAVATSTQVNDNYGYQRSYDPARTYSSVTGYYSVVYGFSGIEAAMQKELSGDADALFYQRVRDLISGRPARGATVELTIDPAMQKAAVDSLDGRKGAVVALDPETGAVLALVSSPTFNPNDLAGHDTTKVAENWKRLQEDPDRPLRNRAISGNLYPAGSTFKLLVAASALQDGGYTKDSVVPGPGSYRLPNSNSTMTNFSGGDRTACGPNNESSLQAAMQQSCNTSFAMLGVKLGEDKLAATLKDYGFGQEQYIPMKVAPSHIATDMDDAQLAMTSIGQYETRVTPMQMAMVAASFANDGVVMEPQVVKGVRTSSLTQVSTMTPKRMSQPLSASNAAQMREMMQATVEDGTGGAARIDGLEVGGKTGTAEWERGKKAHSWFVGYASDGEKKVAIAVIVEEGGYGSRVAAPIARDVMKARYER